MCSKGWTGPTCETVHCATPCQHDGICVGGSCYCKFGWSGIACEEPVCEGGCHFGIAGIDVILGSKSGGCHFGIDVILGSDWII